MDFSDFFPVWNDLKETERRLLTSAATELNVFKGAVISDGKDACSARLYDFARRQGNNPLPSVGARYLPVFGFLHDERNQF